MKIRRRLYTSNIIYKIVPYIVLLVVICLSIGYSAFCSKLNISKTVTKVRLKENIRITNISIKETSNNGQSKYDEYNKENILMGVYLPKDNSTVTYTVEVTNYGNVEMGILDITGLPNNLDYEVTDYELGTKICDSTNTCKLGISKTFNITIKYKSNGNITTATGYEIDHLYDLNLKFDFRQAYNVTYTDITIEDTYPTSVLKGDTLEVQFGDSSPSSVKVLVDGSETKDYTYTKKILTVLNVSGNVEIQEGSSTLVKYIKKLYTPNSAVVHHSITYNMDTTNMLMNDRLGGTTTDYNAGNIRYYGASPKNYIDIGDKNSSGNTILWRIIGVFKNMQITDSNGNVIDTQDLVKIVRNDSIGEYSWDYKDEGNPPYSNDWSNSTLKELLNEAYYNSGTTTYNNWNSSTGKTVVTADFTSIGLSVKSRDKVESVIWNLGGHNTSSVYADGIYQFERGTARYDDTRSLIWSGKVALIYSSDYGYSVYLTKCNRSLYSYNNTTCKQNNWLYGKQYLNLTPTTSVYNVFYIESTGMVRSIETFKTEAEVMPALFLKADVILDSGTGTSTDPYVVSYSSTATASE